jgi:excisionase family DNA binding protein
MPTEASTEQAARSTLWLTKTESAAYAKLGSRLIQNAVNAGELPAYRIGKGREYRLRAVDVDAWLMSRAWEPSA